MKWQGRRGLQRSKMAGKRMLRASFLLFRNQVLSVVQPLLRVTVAGVNILTAWLPSRAAFAYECACMHKARQ